MISVNELVMELGVCRAVAAQVSPLYTAITYRLIPDPFPLSSNGTHQLNVGVRVEISDNAVSVGAMGPTLSNFTDEMEAEVVTLPA